MRGLTAVRRGRILITVDVRFSRLRFSAELNVGLYRWLKTSEQACLFSCQSVAVTVVNTQFMHHALDRSRQQRLILGPSQKFASMSKSPSMANNNAMNAYPHIPHSIFRLNSLLLVSRHPARYKYCSIQSLSAGWSIS